MIKEKSQQKNKNTFLMWFSLFKKFSRTSNLELKHPFFVYENESSFAKLKRVIKLYNSTVLSLGVYTSSVFFLLFSLFSHTSF